MPSKKFKFRLEPLLKVREHRERECQKELAVSLTKVAHQKTAVTGLDSQREATVESQRNYLLGKIIPTQALVYSRYLLRLKKDRLVGAEILRSLERKAEQKRLILLEATKQRKTFEMLKEKQAERHYRSLETEEQKQLDEIATMAYARRHKKGEA